MKLLILASRFPYPLEKGDKLRLFHQITYLSQKHEIILCCLNEEKPRQEDLQKVSALCEEVYVFNIGKTRSLWEMAKAMFKPIPFQVAYFFRKEFLSHIREITQKHKIEHVYCQLLRMGEYAKVEGLPSTIDYMDTFSLGMKRRSEKSPAWVKPLINWEAWKLAYYEQALFSRFNHHLIISSQDREALPLSSEQKAQVHIVPNGIDLDFFSYQASLEKTHELVFVGNLGYYPNEQAARYLVKSLLPKLSRAEPGIRLLLAGARPSQEIRQYSQLPQVDVLGWVDDIRTAYQSGQIFIAPLFTGSGQQNKILEAMALGIPCITTSIVNDAIGAKEGVEILLAETVSDFILQIKKLLDQPGLHASISRNARKFVESHYSWKLSGAALQKILTKKLV
ncbi:MAG: glycosyltransferase [Bacteroidota bacterium]